MRHGDQIHSFFLPPPEGLPLYWVGMGEETRRSPAYRWHGLQRGPDGIVIWQKTVSGRGWIQAGGGEARAVGPGQGFLVHIPSDHCYFQREGDGPWRFVWMMWSGPALRAIWSGLSKTDVQFTPAGSPDFVRALLRSRVPDLPSTRDDAADSFRLLLDLCRSGSPGRASPAAPILPRLEKAARQSPGAPVGKNGLAASLRLSRFQLYRAMKKEAGVGPKGWTSRRRLDQACRLLRETPRPIVDIALAVGLPDANYFARFFRKRTGFSPRDWRRLFSTQAGPD